MSLRELKSGLSRGGTRIHLEYGEAKRLTDEFRMAKKKTFRGLLKEMAGKDSFFPQPVRVQPDLELFYEHPEWSVSKKMAKLTAREVKKWGPKVIADQKYDGARGLLYINPRKREVRIFSRRMKELHKFEKKYADAILDNISNLVKDETVLDVELYATGENGQLLPLSIVTGWVRNPNQEKYKNLIPSIEVFDTVLLNQRDVREMPLKFRKRLVEMTLKKRDGKILDVADTRLMKNHPRPIEWRFKAIIGKKGEGLVLKDPASTYFYGKLKMKNNPWLKVKAAFTLDLAMKAIESSPRGKEFTDYRHWVMVPRDDENHEIHANKGIKAAIFNDEFYRNFSLDMINQWRLGYLAGQGKMVKVRSDLVPFYGVSEVPERLFYPADRRMIVELFTEKITENLHPAGTKIVGIRTDKVVPDTMNDIDELRKFFLGVGKR